MFGKKKKSQEAKEPAVNSDAEKSVFKDRPRPFGILREESAKTAAVQKQADADRGSVDGKLNTLQTSLLAKLENHTKALKEAGEKRIQLRKETADHLTAEVADASKSVAELQQKLADEAARLNRSQKGLKLASRDLKSETGKVQKEFKTSFKSKKKELTTEVATTRKERRAVYAKTARQLRGERWRTLSRTTKETLAVVPDLTVRFARASKRGICEIGSVFSRTAQSMKKGFSEPTTFSIRREKPLEKPKKPAKAKAPTPPPPAA